MATQSLYRRYRPRRFSEVKGQDHVVRALRNAVAEGREGQAYLFSGPRGTGKTTSARILAKVLNCTNPDGGEPCCECDSCLAVERGVSYDVHELDAASNNGVEAMRDLIEKASLGTPGRHKVYILDEVHMLSRAAEAALLKTLEEPPPHVVFVLATTDPQKMSDTIRSRTQHLQFHLLPTDTLLEHVRWVAADAGLTVSDAAIDQVLTQGAGSARDALSALELVSSTGGDGAETVPLHEFVEAMIERDAGRALSMAAGAVALGRDPRALTEELIGYLRNGFMSIMAPELVQLPSQRIEELSTLAQRLGPAGLVRGIEQLGEALTEMRHAPDPRVLLDVAIVRLTSDTAAVDVGALLTRIAKLEQQVAAGVASPAATPPVDAATGRATLGGRARRAPAAPRSGTADAAAGAPTEPEARPDTAEASTVASPPTASGDRPEIAERDADVAPPVASSPEPSASAAATANPSTIASIWHDEVRPSLRGMTRAVFAPAEFVAGSASSLTLSLPNPVHRDKCEQHRREVEAALSTAAGAAVVLDLVIAGGGAATSAGSSDAGSAARPDAPQRDARSTVAGGGGSDTARDAVHLAGDDAGPDTGQEAGGSELPDDDDVDLDDLVDAPPESVKTPIDRLAEAFPGSEMVDETR